MPLMKNGRAKDAVNLDYDVIVGNIGTVYSGTNQAAAMTKFNEFVSQSKTNRGRAGGEDVTLFKNGQIVKEYEGNLEAEDTLKPIPVNDQVLGEGAVGDRKSRRAKDGKEIEYKGWTIAAKGFGTYTAYAPSQANGPGQMSGSLAGLKKRIDEYAAAKDSGLEPIPVNDDTKYATPPKKSSWSGTSAALKTPSEVKEAYAPRGEEGFKKTFGKDDLKPIPVGDSDESDYQEAERKLAAAKKAKASPGKLGELAAKRDDAWRKLAKDSQYSRAELEDYLKRQEQRLKETVSSAMKAEVRKGIELAKAELKKLGNAKDLVPIPVGKAKDADPRRQSYATPSGTTKVDEKLPPSDSLHSYEALAKLAKHLKLSPRDVGSQLMPDGKYHAYAKAPANDCCYFVMS